MNIPDLRHESNDISLEHCSVLLERVRATFGIMYPEGPEEFEVVCNAIDVGAMQEDYKSWFTPKCFSDLFKTQFGKGVLVGAFLKEIMNENIEEESI